MLSFYHLTLYILSQLIFILSLLFCHSASFQLIKTLYFLANNLFLSLNIRIRWTFLIHGAFAFFATSGPKHDTFLDWPLIPPITVGCCEWCKVFILQKEGVLKKYKNLWSGWGTRYFKLERMYLHYFESKDVSTTHTLTVTVISTITNLLQITNQVGRICYL